MHFYGTTEEKNFKHVKHNNKTPLLVSESLIQITLSLLSVQHNYMLQ